MHTPHRRLMPRAGRGCGLALGLLLSGLSGSAWAYRCKHSTESEYLTLHWGDRRVEYAVESDFEAPYPVVQAAFATWAVEPCTDLIFLPQGPVEPGTLVNRVGSVREGWEDAGYDPVAVALTFTFYEPSTGELKRANIALNEEFYDFSDQVDLCPGIEDIFDYGSVLTHEVGHFLGLDHTTVGQGDRNDPTMAPTVEPCGRDKQSLAPDDIAGLCRIYPAGEASQTCLALPIQAGYVSSEAFGCQAHRRSGPAWPGVLLFLSLIALRLAVGFGTGDNGAWVGPLGSPGSSGVQPSARTRASL